MRDAAPSPSTLRVLTSPAGSAVEVTGLLRDCLKLWGVAGRVTVNDDGLTIETSDGTFVLQPAPPDMRPVRWLLQTPTRAAAGRPPRVVPSIVAALSALRNAMEGNAGATLRIGPGSASP